jgi:hypothetical protein
MSPGDFFSRDSSLPTKKATRERLDRRSIVGRTVQTILLSWRANRSPVVDPSIRPATPGFAPTTSPPFASPAPAAMPAGSLVAASRPRAFFLGGARLPGGRVRGAGVRGASVRGAPPRVVRAVVDPERDTILVAGCKERVAQCSVDQLSKNARSAGTRVVAILPGSCYEGVRNPLDAMAKDLLYPDRPMIDCLSALDAVECMNTSDAGAYDALLKDATHVILANEYAPDLLASARRFVDDVAEGKCPRLRRVVLLSHIGVERRDEDPWKFMNRKTKVGTGIIGKAASDGGAPLDKWLEAERLIAEAREKKDGDEKAWTWTVVRVGDLRGNGPTSVTYGDAMLTLVDNAFDVRMQDIIMEEGDRFEGFAKRLSVAVVMNRMLTTNSFATRNKIYSLVSDGPVDRERRKGWDVAKGRSPPPIEDKVVDEELAPKEEEEAETQGAPVPEPA